MKSKDKQNPKAFGVQSIVSGERSFRKRADIAQKRAHLPKVDRQCDDQDPAPVLVAVAGPPRVGKSTLIRCLLKQYTNQSAIGTICGPVTVIANKHRRLTFLECPNDIFSMIDVVKCADLILLMIDASFGFQMEIFELLSICQAHGFPRIMGVLNHLDAIENIEKRRKTRKQLKQRFWTEVYKGAKMFYLTRIIDNSMYVKQEVHNLCRFISVMKFNDPPTWRSNHPYVLVDRIEKVARKNSEDGLCSLQFYGYLRGTVNMRQKCRVHLAGCGDFDVCNIQKCSDPCRLPDKDEGKKRRRSLKHIERGIYGHFCGLGGILYDENTVVIDLAGSHAQNTNEKNALTEAKVDSKSNIRIVASDASDCEENEGTDEDFEDGDMVEIVKGKDYDGELPFSESDDDDDCSVQFRGNLFTQKQHHTDWKSIVYKETAFSNDTSDELAGLFRLKQKSNIDMDDYHHRTIESSGAQNIQELTNLIKNCFVTGQWDENTDAEALLDAHDNEEDTHHPAEALRSHGPDFEGEEESSFLKELNDQAAKQEKLNKTILGSMSEKERLNIEGYRQGMYLRLEIDKVPIEFINNFVPSVPILIGGLNSLNHGSSSDPFC
ncbi:hypothetical protein ACOME3_006023 [Neoechinorhynchus agilis]